MTCHPPLLGALFGALLVALPAWGHEGHDEAPAPTGAPSARHALTAVSDRYEVVLKNDPLVPGKAATLDLYLSDFTSNAPIAGAQISLGVRSGARELWKGDATATGRPGVYAVQFAAPVDTGTFNVLVTVRAAGREDRFALAGLDVELAEHTSARGRRASFPWPWVIAGILALVVAFQAWLSRRRAATHAALLIAGLLAAAPAPAHEGHDEAPVSSGTPVAPGAEVYMAKESQFLLGVRTVPVRRESVRSRLTVLGRVAPRGGSEVEIIAPQSGRIQFPGGRPPVVGQSVGRDQLVGDLVVVDALGLRAPVSGTITGVFAVSGQLVQAGQKIITMLDPSVVWVHADVYEADQASVQRSTRAIVSSQAMPGVALPARRVAMGVTQGEVQGAVEVWFEVPNPGGRLKVGALVDAGIEIGGAEPSLVVPLSSVFEKDGRKLVFVHTAPERFAAREVRIVTSLAERAAVAGDLVPGDRVVTTGGYQLLSSPAAGLNR